MYKFFKSDLDALVQKRDNLVNQVREAGQLVGEATNQSSETWHDNAPYDAAKLQFEQLQQRQSELDAIVKGAQVIDPIREAPKNVVMGTKVSYRDNSGEVRQVKIGSYIPAETSGSISYNAPLARILIGGKVGDTVGGEITGRATSFDILGIELF